MEVYTGWVAVNFEGGDSIDRDEFVSFLCTDKQKVQPYSKGDLNKDNFTVTVAPSSVADDDDEANVAAVDGADVELEQQPGIAGSPYCLVLKTKVAALNATIHAITYQVTVQSKFKEDLYLEPIEIPEESTPK